MHLSITHQFAIGKKDLHLLCIIAMDWTVEKEWNTCFPRDVSVCNHS